MVAGEGLEPSSPYERLILSQLRLPVSPPRHLCLQQPYDSKCCDLRFEGLKEKVQDGTGTGSATALRARRLDLIDAELADVQQTLRAALANHQQTRPQFSLVAGGLIYEFRKCITA